MKKIKSILFPVLLMNMWRSLSSARFRRIYRRR